MFPETGSRNRHRDPISRDDLATHRSLSGRAVLIQRG
jgi:hypothetical protein